MQDTRLIEGDNLDVLRALLATHVGKVRCVYIDPPYNTQHPLAYNDRRTSDAWAAMMHERLTATLPLLEQCGSVWVSIDDNEVAALRQVGDAVFGRANFIATVVWQKRLNRENRSTFSQAHEYIVVYAKDAAAFKKARHPIPAPELGGKYKNPDNDPRGPWQPVPLTVQAGHATASQTYAYTTPAGRSVTPPAGRAWSLTHERMTALMLSGEVWFGKGGNGAPTRKKYLAGASLALTPSTLWYAEEVGDNASARTALIKLMDGDARFDTPKPVGLIRRVLEIATDANSVVLDFFAGSGTTAHAVAELNAADGGARQCILVQSSETFATGEGKIFDYMTTRVSKVHAALAAASEAQCSA